MKAQLYEYTKSHWRVHFKKVNFMGYELYIIKDVTKNNLMELLPAFC